MVYEALKKGIKESPRMEDFLELLILERRLISRRRLIEGGAAMFPVLKRNPHRPNLGINLAKPYINKRAASCGPNVL